MKQSKPFIAALHDIGKLVDWDASGLKGIIRPGSPRHTFSNFDFLQLKRSSPSCPSWWGQFSDDVESLTSTKVPIDFISDVILTKIADEVASSISRTWGRKGKVAEGLYVLWKPNFYQQEVENGKEWAAFTTPEKLKEMFCYYDDCSNAEDFFKTYEENLRLTAEDKSAPFNIIDLLTHLELTEKIFRILKRHSRFDRQENKLIYWNTEIQQATEATGGRVNEPKQRGKWVYRLVFCRIYFSQSLIRLQDLNVFRKRTDLIKNYYTDSNTKDYVLFSTDDFMCLFIPIEAEIKIKNLLEPFLEAGFVIHYKEMEAELNLLTSSPERAYHRFHSSATSRNLRLYYKNLNPDLAKELKPPLCDSCQARLGKERAKDRIREYLCDVCFKIREMGEPAREYANWEGKAGWMKITLDQDRLLKTLHRLFDDYVDNSPYMYSVSNADKALLKEAFRPLAVQMKFVKDYKMVLQIFKQKIYEDFSKESFLYPIDDYYEFGIFKFCSGEDVLKILDLFSSLQDTYLPECSKDSPVKLSISIAHVKYPFQEHWRFLSNPINVINLQGLGSANLAIDLVQYRLLIEKIKKEGAKLNHFIHRLAGIEAKTKSNFAVMIETLENRKKFPALLELTQSGLSVDQVLNFYKSTREGLFL